MIKVIRAASAQKRMSGKVMRPTATKADMEELCATRRMTREMLTIWRSNKKGWSMVIADEAGFTVLPVCRNHHTSQKL